MVRLKRSLFLFSLLLGLNSQLILTFPAIPGWATAKNALKGAGNYIKEKGKYFVGSDNSYGDTLVGKAFNASIPPVKPLPIALAAGALLALGAGAHWAYKKWIKSSDADEDSDDEDSNSEESIPGVTQEEEAEEAHGGAATPQEAPQQVSLPAQTAQDQAKVEAAQRALVLQAEADERMRISQSIEALQQQWLKNEQQAQKSVSDNKDGLDAVKQAVSTVSQKVDTLVQNVAIIQQQVGHQPTPAESASMVRAQQIARPYRAPGLNYARAARRLRV